MIWMGRLILWLMLLGSVGLTLRAGAQIAANPALSPLIDRTADQIAAEVELLLAREASPARLTALIQSRLAEEPRNWVALQALADLAAERGVTLTPAYSEAWDADSGLMAAVSDCGACIWDIATCSLSTALICKAPILLTPAEDLRGVLKAAADYSGGEAVDRLDLGLSIVGLGATAALIATGGTSGTVKAGAATIRLARGMGRLSPALGARITAALGDGIRWADLPAVRGADDLTALLRPEILRPISVTLTDLGRVAEATGPMQALHLLPLVDDATDASRLARVAEAMGPRTVAGAEVLGKSRLLRASLRYGDTAIEALLGLIGALISAAMMVAGAVQSLLLRRLRRALS